MTSNILRQETDEVRVLARRLIDLLAPVTEAVEGLPECQKDGSQRSCEKKGHMREGHDLTFREIVGPQEDKSDQCIHPEVHDELVLRYPIVQYDMPQLVEDGLQLPPKVMSTAINIRISLSLSLTLREHIGCLQGVTQSEWIRDAVLAKLSAEQKERSRRRSRYKNPSK